MGSGGMRSGRSRTLHMTFRTPGGAISRRDALNTQRALDAIQRAPVGTMINAGDNGMYRVTGTLRDRSLQQVSRIHETWDADRRRTIRKRIKVRAGESVSLRDTTSLIPRRQGF